MNTVVLFSGGLDSLACIAHYRHSGMAPEALFVDYGQRARVRELAAATALARRLDFPLHVTSLAGLHVGEGCIPGRNALLLTIALMHRGDQCGIVSLGIHEGTSYPDCTQHFVDRMQAVYDVYSGGALRVDAPFVRSSKADVWQFLIEQGYPVEHTYSCEMGDVPCGSCLSCRDIQSLHAR